MHSFFFQVKMSCNGDFANNTTLEVENILNTTGDRELYERVYHIAYGYGLPTVCVCGFLGNVMNLIILAGKQAQRQLRKTEQAANVGLLALAVADLMFCVTAFPSTFLPKDMQFAAKAFLTYYGVYCAAIINIFIMTSTWLTVTMATERYLAICHPLKSRKVLTLRRTKVAIIMVYILSALFNLPVFWRYHLEDSTCNNITTYMVAPRVVYNNQFDHAYRAMWAVFGNFIPLFLLLLFNIALMREIHRSYAMRKSMNGNSGVHKHANDSEASNRITITLVSIVVMFFILVAPSEILKHVAYLFGADLTRNYTYSTIEIITNLMQTINFSANFVLYCVINPSFRRTMKEMFCFQYQKLKSDGLEASIMDHQMRDRYSSVRLSQHGHHSPKVVTMSVRSLR